MFRARPVLNALTEGLSYQIIQEQLNNHRPILMNSPRHATDRTREKCIVKSLRAGRALSIVAVVLISCAPNAAAQSRAAWMRDVKWGVMNHYLADLIAKSSKLEMNATQWNKLVDQFDVEGLADELKSVGASYYQISIGQNSGYYLSPNATYDKMTGIVPSKCSRRDLVASLYEALHKQEP